MFITNIHTFLSLAFNHDFTGSEIAKHNDTDNATPRERWLSDGTITGYFAMLQLIDSYLQSIQPQPSNRHRSLFINSIQLAVLEESINSRNWIKVKRFWKRQLLHIQSPSPLSIFDMDKIFIAENVNDSHWTMTVIFFKHKSIVYYDSYNAKPNDSNPNPLLDMLENMDSSNEQKQFDRKEWRFTLATCVQQHREVIFLLFFEYSSNYSE